jgi:hypothetical protein
VWLAVVVLVLFRSAIFVFRPQIAFNSDQAVFGLMAKHITEGRAFPLFMYGQNYILAVEAWLPAPIFALFGPSMTALKLPLLAVNIAIGILLVEVFVRELGLRPVLALVAGLFFILAPPGTVATLLAPDGGEVEPFLYVILLWLTRRRPIWFGLILGVGFLQREFTIYGALAIGAVALMTGAWRNRASWTLAFKALATASVVWLLVQQGLRRFAPGAGPGTLASNLHGPANNLLELRNRFCFDPGTLTAGFGRLVTQHWPRLFGTEHVRAYTFGLESNAWLGISGVGVALAALVSLVLLRIVMRAAADRAWLPHHPFGAYLALVGVLSAAGFVVGRCGYLEQTRYDLLSLLGGAGLIAWAFAHENRRWIRWVEVGLVLVWATASIAGHAAIWVEYTSHPPPVAKNLIVKHLEASGVRYARSDYWIAYWITFATDERIIVASDEAFPRIAMYRNIVDAHAAEAVRISREPCGTTRPAFDSVYFCPP